MNKEYKIHACYIVAILVAIIIALTTSKWGDNPKLVDFVNFAATLTSLVLAVLAIIYAFLSNASVAKSMNEITSASSAMSTTADNISNAAKELSNRIETIPTKLESMEGQFKELASSLQRSDPIPVAENPNTNVTWTTESMSGFIGKANLEMWLALHTFYLSFKTGKSFHLTELFFENIEAQPAYKGAFIPMYIFGVMQTMRNMGLLSFTLVETKTTVTAMNEILHANLSEKAAEIFREKLAAKVKNEDGEAKAKMAKYFEDKFNEIELYFAEAPNARAQPRIST